LGIRAEEPGGISLEFAIWRTAPGASRAFPHRVEIRFLTAKSQNPFLTATKRRPAVIEVEILECRWPGGRSSSIVANHRSPFGDPSKETESQREPCIFLRSLSLVVFTLAVSGRLFRQRTRGNGFKTPRPRAVLGEWGERGNWGRRLGRPPNRRPITGNTDGPGADGVARAKARVPERRAPVRPHGDPSEVRRRGFR